MKFKFFKKALIPFLILSGLSSCNKNSEVLPKGSGVIKEDGQTPQDPNEGDDGGISAGGGGTLPADPISVYEVMRVVDQAKLLLRMTLNASRRFPPREPISTVDKFMYGERNLATQLEITDLEVLEDKPCKNKFGKNVDASIYASRPNTICLSAFRVAPKLIKEIATKEILALIGHELSHFLGANESEAIDVQKSLAWDLSNVTSLNPIDLENKLWMYPMRIESLSAHQGRIKDAVKKGDLKDIMASFRELTHELADIESGLPSISISFTDYQTGDYLRLIYSRIRLAETFVESIDPTNTDFQNEAKEDYEKCFNGQLEITPPEVSKDCLIGFDKDTVYPFYKFQKLSDLSQIPTYLNDVFQFINDYGAQVRAIVFNNVLPYFNLPSLNPPVDPWIKFYGSYVIGEKNCSTTGGSNWFENLETIVIQPGLDNYPVPNKPISVMVEKGHGMTSWYNMGNGVNINAMFVHGGENWASVEESRGTRWYDRQGHGWGRTVKTLREENGQLLLEMKQETFRVTSTQIEEGHSMCQFKLVPQN